ncbi:hypothetical protein [Spirochaeta thermophila]|uniref:Uncharacterized protein n=1 Tax=Winmispira thermophila (strain ATCC 49972 / DSM 6192 / RI 19.B1) TaxID=665571 RepID=E0RS97_WINT6|nr:hypothetical protein [Spirochaeta thermophila]ADN01884.1 hypothetical protein STHERM_c09370 [Spirochaeta thermophila DSM 6192]
MEWLWFLGGLIGGTLWSVFLINRKIEQKVETLEFMNRVRRELEEILASCNETTDRNVSILEHRVSGLRKLVDRADKRIQVLQDLLRRSEDLAPRAVPESGEAGEPADRTTPPETERSSGEVGAPGTTRSPDTPEEPVVQGDIPSPREPNPVREIQGQKGLSPLSETVLSLYRNGHPPERIARELGLTVGEVDLIISLEKTVFLKDR